MKYATKRSELRTNGGFTLVELIVSMGLFIVVVFGTTSAMLSMLDANRKAQAMRTAMEGLGFALDDIGRSVRVGGNYECLTSIPSDAQAATDPVFNSNSGYACIGVKIRMDIGTIVYYVDGNTHELKKSFFPRGGGPGGYTQLVLTPPELTVNPPSAFYVLGDQTNDQPRVLINIVGVAGDKPGFLSTFHIQTTVSARLPNAQIN